MSELDSVWVDAIFSFNQYVDSVVYQLSTSPVLVAAVLLVLLLLWRILKPDVRNSLK